MTGSFFIRGIEKKHAPPPAGRADFLPLLPKGRIENVLYRAQVALREREIDPEILRATVMRLGREARELVFPSHFFEYQGREQCLQWMEEASLSSYVQISPGAELRDYFSRLCEWQASRPGLKLGIELVMDRAPHSLDWELINQLQKAGLPLRFVYCPVHEFPALSVLKALPATALARLSLYFPKKINARDSFLTADEIFLLMENISGELPGFQLRVVEHLAVAEGVGTTEVEREESAFRRNPSAEAYADAFPRLGAAGKFRALVYRLVQHALLFPIVTLPHLALFSLLHPVHALTRAGHFVLFIALFVFHGSLRLGLGAIHGMQSLARSTYLGLLRLRHFGRLLAGVVKQILLISWSDLRHYGQLACSLTGRFALGAALFTRNYAYFSFRRSVDGLIYAATVLAVEISRVHYLAPLLAFKARNATLITALATQLIALRMLHWLRMAWFAIKKILFFIYFDFLHVVFTRIFFRLYHRAVTAGFLAFTVAMNGWMLVRHFVLHPVWAIQTYLPPVYHFGLMPIFRLYWFADFQFRKRVLRSNEEKAEVN